jgi:hypothetical protein
MTGAESRNLQIGARVYWNDDKSDAGTIVDKNWSGLTIKWDSREQQNILHNDMAGVKRA